MIKSKFFWLGIISLVIIPFLTMDVPKHYIDWKSEVRDNIYAVAQNSYSYTAQQKDQILDDAFRANKSLLSKMFIKSFAGMLLFFSGIYFLLRYTRDYRNSFWKTVIIAVFLIGCSVAIKLYLWTNFGGDQKIKLLSLAPSDTTLGSIYNHNFKGKLLYVDFWGTNCGPCLEEFMNFTKPLKQKYHSHTDIAYLYIASGRRIIWKQQLQKFDIEGVHVFLNDEGYKIFTSKP